MVKIEDGEKNMDSSMDFMERRKRIKRLGKRAVLELAAYENEDGTALNLMESPRFKREPEIVHGFSTRFGGVSEGDFSSMNLSFTRGDETERVSENFRRIAAHFGKSPEHFVLSHQTHTAEVRKVTREDMGKGVTKERDYRDVDALITNESGLILGVFWADCVPILLYDPEKRAIGVIHSGWRGTAGRIALKTVQKMQEEYGSRPEALLAAIGPSICRNCYEISGDVAEQFMEDFSGNAGQILRKREKGKYLLDLWECNRIILREAGLREENIEKGDICTCCNPWLSFSHRAQGERRGNNGAFLMLREKKLAWD